MLVLYACESDSVVNWIARKDINTFYHQLTIVSGKPTSLLEQGRPGACCRQVESSLVVGYRSLERSWAVAFRWSGQVEIQPQMHTGAIILTLLWLWGRRTKEKWHEHNQFCLGKPPLHSHPCSQVLRWHCFLGRKVVLGSDTRGRLRVERG